MKKKSSYLLLSLASILLAFASCQTEEESTLEVSDLCYISNFSLGSVKRAHYTVGSDGKDSVYYTVYSASIYPMTINQRTLTIENLDSLPVNTKVAAVTSTCSFNGLLSWRKIVEGQAPNEGWSTYSSEDSLDFSSPLEFMVISTDASSRRSYTVKVNVHQQEGNTTVWHQMGKADALDVPGQRKAVVWNGRFMVLTAAPDGALTNVSCALKGSNAWTEISLVGAQGAQPSTLQNMNGKLYMSTTDGRVLHSTDGVEWTAAPFPVHNGLTLVAASAQCLYAMADGKLLISNGGEWQTEKLDDETSLLPTNEVQSVFYTMPNGMQRILLVGQSLQNGKMVTRTWAKSWNEGEEQRESWIFYTDNAANTYHLPVMTSLNILPYDKGFIALGGAAPDGSRTALKEVLRSRDHGITWRPYVNEDMNIDATMQQTAATAQNITCAVDADQYVWVAVDGQVWKGRINRLGFLCQDD